MGTVTTSSFSGGDSIRCIVVAGKVSTWHYHHGKGLTCRHRFSLPELAAEGNYFINLSLVECLEYDDGLALIDLSKDVHFVLEKYDLPLLHMGSRVR